MKPVSLHSATVIRKAGGKRASGYQTGPDSTGRQTKTPMFTVPAITIGGRTGAQYSSIPQSLAEERVLDTFLRGQTPFYTLKSMIAAGHELGPLEFVVLPLKPPDDFQIFLGDNFLAQHVVCLDYKNREVRVR